MIQWGAQLECCHELGSMFLVCACRISETEYIASSSRETFVFDRSRVRSRHSYVFNALAHCPTCDLVFGVSSGITYLHTFQPESPNQIISCIALGQHFVNQIEVCPLTQSLITAGNTIRVWTYQYTRPQMGFRMRLRSEFPTTSFCSGFQSIFVDRPRERVLIPSQSGYRVLSFDGKLLSETPNISAFSLTSIAIQVSPRKYPGIERNHSIPLNLFKLFAGTDPSGTIRLWYPSGMRMASFPTAQASLIYIGFVDNVFIVAVDINGAVFLLDYRTGKIGSSLNLRCNPHRVCFTGGRLIVLSGYTVFVMKLQTLWKLFYRPLYGVVKMTRFTSDQFSARVGVTSKDGSFLLISVNRKYVIGEAASRTRVLALSSAYERDCSDSALILFMADSSVWLYCHEEHSFVQRQELPMRGGGGVICRGSQKLVWLVVCAGAFSDLCVYGYGTWELIKRFQFGKLPFRYLFWWQTAEFIIAISGEYFVVMDVVNLCVVSQASFVLPDMVAFDEGSLLLVNNQTQLCSFQLTRNGDLISIQKSTFSHPITVVTASFGVNVVVFEDQTIMIGPIDQFPVVTLSVPFPVHAVTFLNADLDLLLAFDGDIVAIRGCDHFPQITPTVRPPRELNELAKPDLLVPTPPRVPMRMPTPQPIEEVILERSKESVDDVLMRIHREMERKRAVIFSWVPPPIGRPPAHRHARPPPPPSRGDHHE
jgi:hypothetical protein